MRRVLVVGATGETGKRVVARLRPTEASIRVLSRSAARARARLGEDIECHEGDVRDPVSLQGIADGVDTVICTLGTRSFMGSNGTHAVDSVGTGNLVRALSKSSPHVVLLTAFGLDRRSIFLDAFSLALNQYFRWKADAESALRASGLRYTIVRPVELRNRPARSGPLLNQHEPLTLLRTVSRDLVADVLVACVDNDAAIGKTFEVCEGSDEPIDEQLRSMAPEGERRLPKVTPLCGWTAP